LAIELAEQAHTRTDSLVIYRDLKELAIKSERQNIRQYQATAAFGISYLLVNTKEFLNYALEMYFDLKQLSPNETKQLANLALLLIPRIASADIQTALILQDQIDELASREPAFVELAFTSGVSLLPWLRLSPTTHDNLVNAFDKLTDKAEIWEILVNRLVPSAKREAMAVAGERRMINLQALAEFLAAATFGASRVGRLAIAEALSHCGGNDDIRLSGAAGRVLFCVAWGDRASADEVIRKIATEDPAHLHLLLKLANLHEHPWLRGGEPT